MVVCLWHVGPQEIVNIDDLEVVCVVLAGF